jgi:hypothetical protein
MDMQDKEFDQIFNQKFQNFEEEPSPMVWDNIAGKLDGKKSTRSIMPWLSIAATVLVIVTAGVLFLKNGNEAGVPKIERKPIASRVKPTVTTKEERGGIKQADPVPTAQPATVAKLTKVIAPIAAARQHTNIASTKNVDIAVNVTPADILDHEPLISNQPIIATITNPASAKIQATLPDVQLAPKIADTESRDGKAITASAERQNAEPVKKRGIHSFGGLINAVVAKIDKRDDKLIEFSDGDGDDDNSTTVTGVNLGLIKIKKQ